MNIDKTNKHTHIKSVQNSTQEILTELKNRYSEFKDEHLIIDFSESININIEELLLFLKLSTSHRENGMSFVIVCKDIDIDEISDEINVIPTFTEALDILEMDAIERDLGF